VKTITIGADGIAMLDGVGKVKLLGLSEADAENAISQAERDRNIRMNAIVDVATTWAGASDERAGELMIYGVLSGQSENSGHGDTRRNGSGRGRCLRRPRWVPMTIEIGVTMASKMRPFRRGTILIQATIVFLVVAGICTLGVDVARVRLAKSSMLVAADAGFACGNVAPAPTERGQGSCRVIGCDE